jgi:hypothetical protein
MNSISLQNIETIMKFAKQQDRSARFSRRVGWCSCVPFGTATRYSTCADFVTGVMSDEIHRIGASDDSRSTRRATAQNCAVPGLQREVQDQSPRPVANLLRSVLPSARLRATKMVEAASRRAARTGYRLRQGARFYQGAGTRTFARSRNHPPPSITAHAKATASAFAPGGKIGSCAAAAE